MNQKDLAILNSLVTYAAENIPGGLNTEEHEVAFQVAVWTKDGVPVRQICPHCGASAPPRGEGRLAWLEDHIDSGFHRAWWGMKNQLQYIRAQLTR